MVKPIVKWAGGKRQILKHLLERIPIEWDIYYEPFAGGLALLTALYTKGKIGKAVISDLNEELINLYVVIKERPQDLLKELRKKIYHNDKETYLKLREEFNRIRGNQSYDVRRAALFLYLNRHGYNGLWRVNSKGEFNVPFGRYKNPKMPDEKHIMKFHEMLKNITILNEDFEIAVRNINENDFVYFDPPYQPVSKTAYFTDYTSAGFDSKEQRRLAALCRKLDEKGVYFMVSNSDTPLIRELYEGFNIYVVEANRNINSKADRRKGITEVIITNYTK